MVDCPACEELRIVFHVNKDRLTSALSRDDIYWHPDKDHILIIIKEDNQFNFIVCSSDTNVAIVHDVSVERFNELIDNNQK